MKKRTLCIDCDSATARQLAEAIRAYVHAAYPEGGSACTQVARETLLGSAALCESHADGGLILRKRQLPMLRAAVRWYFSVEGPGNVELGPHLETRLGVDNKSTA
jgi:hypothetical protein